MGRLSAPTDKSFPPPPNLFCTNPRILHFYDTKTAVGCHTIKEEVLVSRKMMSRTYKRVTWDSFPSDEGRDNVPYDEERDNVPYDEKDFSPTIMPSRTSKQEDFSCKFPSSRYKRVTWDAAPSNQTKSSSPSKRVTWKDDFSCSMPSTSDKRDELDVAQRDHMNFSMSTLPEATALHLYNDLGQLKIPRSRQKCNEPSSPQRRKKKRGCSKQRSAESPICSSREDTGVFYTDCDVPPAGTSFSSDPKPWDCSDSVVSSKSDDIQVDESISCDFSIGWVKDFLKNEVVSAVEGFLSKGTSVQRSHQKVSRKSKKKISTASGTRRQIKVVHNRASLPTMEFSIMRLV